VAGLAGHGGGVLVTHARLLGVRVPDVPVGTG